MPRHLEKLIILSLIMGIFFTWPLRADQPGNLRFSLPVSLLFSKNEVKATHLDLGAGLSADWWIIEYGNWHFGPGLSLLTTLPAANGNRMVSIKPYSLLGEMRAMAGYGIFGLRQGVMPYLALGTQIGGLIVAKEVARQKMVDGDFLMSAIGSAGITYWIQGFGIGIAYGLIIGNQALRNKLELSVHYSFNAES